MSGVAIVSIITEADALGGLVVHTCGLIEALARQGCAVEVVANRFDPYTAWVRSRGLEAQVRVIGTSLAGITPETPADLRGWSEILAGLKGECMIFPKGHHSHGRIEFLRLCRRRFRSLVFIEHLEAPAAPRARPLFGMLPRPAFAWRMRRWRRRQASRCADRIIAVSEKVRDRLVNDWGVPPGDVVVVRNGVRWQDFLRDAAAAARFRAAHGLAPETFVFGMMTRLTKVKGIDLALRALRGVADTLPGRDVRLVIAGEGPDESGLVSLAAELGVPTLVHFAGAVSHPAEALSAYDVILFSSRYEGLPLALLEGMAAGCIPIVTDVGGMREAVTGPAAGWVVAAEDPAALAAAMWAVLALDAPRIEELRAGAALRIREEFDGDACFRRILELCGIKVPVA